MSINIKPIALHDNHKDWFDKWVEYCQHNDVPYKTVNCYDSDILDQLKDCSALMWMLTVFLPQDKLVGPAVLAAAANMGLHTFPNYQESWHFNDKLSQKYLLESLGLPTPKAWAFFDRKKALEFVGQCELPIVAKLRGGASSTNVQLLRTRSEAAAYVRRMFGRGFSPVQTPLHDARQRIKVAMHIGGMHEIMARLKRAPRESLRTLRDRWYAARERAYVYLQQFIPDNPCDYRMVVVGDKCWGYRRMVRKGDFRASGSHMEDMNPENIPGSLVQAAFAAADKLAMRSVGIDYVLDHGQPLIVELCYTYGVDDGEYEGFWDRKLCWHQQRVDPRQQVVEDLVREIISQGE